jgi:hypothetical protein
LTEQVPRNKFDRLDIKLGKDIKGMSMKLKILAGCLACGLLFSQFVRADETGDQLREMIVSGRFDAAYAIAEQHQDRLGEPGFDILYGLAAIETGRASEGILALERYRMAAPQDSQAALHLARGYLLLGEAARARADLETMIGAGLGPDLAEVANALLDVARMQESATAGGARGYVEAGLGSDSNVNGGVSGSVVTLPVFGQVTLPGATTRTGDTFAQVAAGAQGTRFIEPGLALFGAIDFNARGHAQDNNYDQNVLGGNVGVSLNRAGTIWRATASHQTLWLDSIRYRSVTGLAGDWATGIYPGGMVNAFLQYARFEYGDRGADQRDADFYGVGVGYRKIFTGALRPALNLSLTLGDERNDQNHPEYSRNLWGMSGSFSIRPLPRLTLAATLMHQESDYDADDPLLLVTRHDRYDSLTLGATYLLDRQLSLRGEIIYADNQSNIPLYEYDRLQGLVKLRYEF